MDAQKTINEVVDGVKSEGLFDAFRKECLEEFEVMETYAQLKQRVENHVTSFLSKHKFHEGLQKNSLRSNLRGYISKSDVLLNGITQLVDEVLSLKGKSFCLRIDKHVDKHLNKQLQPAATPETPVPPPIAPATTLTTSDNKTGQSSSETPIQNGIQASSESNNLVQEETVTDFTEMEIEEVEMDLSENQDAGTPTIDEDSGNHSINKMKTKKTMTGTGSSEEKKADVKMKAEVDEVMASTVDSVVTKGENTKASAATKEAPENMFKPITPPETNDEPGEEENHPEKEVKSSEQVTPVQDEHDDDTQREISLPPIITEPITDDSNSNDSFFADNIKAKMAQRGEAAADKKDDNDGSRRKSSRVRTLPMKFRENNDDADSVSSNDIDYKDLEDGTYLSGKRGRQKKRPNSAGNPETPSGKTKSRKSSVDVENTRRKKEKSPVVISRQEEAAIDFLAKPEVRKSLKREGRSSNDETPDKGSRSTRDRDENSSEKEGKDRHSSRERRKSDSEKEERKRDKKSRDGGGSSSLSKDDDSKAVRREHKSGSNTPSSNKDEKSRHKNKKDRIKLESGDSCYSGVVDDEKTSRKKRDKNTESRDSGTGSSKESEKSRERKERKLSDSSNSDERRAKKSDKSDMKSDKSDKKSDKSDKKSDKSDMKTDKSDKKSDKSDKRLDKSDNKPVATTTESGKGDSESRKSKTKREEPSSSESRSNSREKEKESRKRYHSPTPPVEEVQSKRSRTRFIKKRERYSPP